MGCPVIGNDDEHKVLHFLNYAGYGGCFAGYQTVLCFGGSSVGCAVSIGVGAGRRFGRSVSDKIGGAALRRDGSVCPFIEVPSENQIPKRSGSAAERFRSQCFCRMPQRTAKLWLKEWGLAKKESFFHNFPHFCAHFLRMSSCVKCAQTQSSRLKNFIFFNLYTSVFLLCAEKK